MTKRICDDFMGDYEKDLMFEWMLAFVVFILMGFMVSIYLNILAHAFSR